MELGPKMAPKNLPARRPRAPKIYTFPQRSPGRSQNERATCNVARSTSLNSKRELREVERATLHVARSFWERPGSFLAPFWLLLKPFWLHFGRFWCPFCSILERLFQNCILWYPISQKAPAELPLAPWPSVNLERNFAAGNLDRFSGLQFREKRCQPRLPKFRRSAPRAAQDAIRHPKWSLDNLLLASDNYFWDFRTMFDVFWTDDRWTLVCSSIICFSRFNQPISPFSLFGPAGCARRVSVILQ